MLERKEKTTPWQILKSKAISHVSWCGRDKDENSCKACMELVVVVTGSHARIIRGSLVKEVLPRICDQKACLTPHNSRSEGSIFSILSMIQSL